MKLYTEKEVKKAMLIYHNALTLDYVLSQLNPIELPSDEEIDDEATHYIESGSSNSFRSGAKWLRDKIQGGHK